MKYFAVSLLLLLFNYSVFAQNDCTEALVVCGNSGFAGLSAIGSGTQELDPSSNDCQSNENNSLWLRLNIKTGGTLGFTLKPTSPNINVDFDFFIFGPHVTCGQIGHAIRCSTTNPEAANSPNNHTGTRDTETDISEGPGQFGNNFVQSLNVLPGENYFLVIDRPVGSSDFSIEWTGTASFNDVPLVNIPTGTSLKLEKCDDDGVFDNITTFDLTTNEPTIRGSQTNIAITYHRNQNGATTGDLPIANPSAFRNTANPQNVFMRLTNTLTGCFTTRSFQLEITGKITAGNPADLALCDLFENGRRQFNLAQNDAAVRGSNPNTSVRYYGSLPDAQNEVNPHPALYINATPNETVWARLERLDGCFEFDIVTFTLSIIPLPQINYTLDVVDFTQNQNSITILMDDAALYEFALGSGEFSDNRFFGNLEPGIYNIFIQSKNTCKVISEEVVILDYPKFFTPNGDAINDTWRVLNMIRRPDATINIFDRYGKIVSSFRGNATGWDGTFNGKALPASDYWFTINYDNGRIIRGHFAMVR